MTLKNGYEIKWEIDEPNSTITVNVLDTRSPLSHDFIREVENKGENGAGMMPGAPRRGVRAVAPGRR
jgi:hypothetical protein